MLNIKYVDYIALYKKTEIGAAARFLDNTGYVTGSVNIDSNVGNVTSYDNGPGSATTTV